MATTSALLRSAGATRKKVRQQEDALQAFIWESSAQTEDEFKAYEDYLQQRQGDSTDPSEQLTYLSKIRTVRRTFTSNELQREQMKIMDGSGTTQSKMAAVENLYNQAVANEDYNLAQNLISQWQVLDIKQQNEADAAAKASQTYYRSLASSRSANLKEAVNKLLKGDELVDMNGQQYIPFARLNTEVQDNGKLLLEDGTEINPFKAAQDTLKALQELIQQGINSATDQEEVDKLVTAYEGYFDGSKNIKLFGKDFSNQDIDLAVASEDANNPLFSLEQKYNPATGKQEFSVRENSVKDFQLIRTGQDAEGNDLYAPLQQRRIPQDNAKFQSPNAKITDNGEFVGDTGNINLGAGSVNRDDQRTIKQRLEALGIQVRDYKEDGDGTLTITLPDGQSYQAVISPNGKLRYFGQPGASGTGLYEISLFDEKNIGPYGLDITAGESREVAADESSIFGQASEFGGMVSQASDAGRRTMSAYTNPDVLGSLRTNDLSRGNISGFGGPRLTGSILQGNDFTGRGGAATSALLQSANMTIQAKAAEQQAAQMQASQQAAARLQATPTFNLNQTPVQQFASNGMPIRQLVVTRPMIAPTIKVAPPPAPRAPLQVAPANNLGQLGITGNYTGTLRVR